ncbi:MAG: methylmalonyl-CoA carboxyltransferase, partial [Burkholderiales bacterium]
MAFDDLLNDLEMRRAKALAMGGAEKLAKRRTIGLLNARERINYLFDAGTFMESGLFATSVHPQDAERSPADGKIAGFGQV